MGAFIYKNTLKFITNAWWFIVWHRITPTTIDNTLCKTSACLVTALVSGIDLNIHRSLWKEFEIGFSSLVLHFVSSVSSHN